MAAMTSNAPTIKRGAFVLLEGGDRCGKSSQAAMISKYLSEGVEGAATSSNELIRFPNRESSIGQLINSYLQSTSDLSDQAIHLLFSANRWESSSELQAKLESGCSLICDRYAYSGVAFTSAKGLDMDWCKMCDNGLPAPDCIIYLDITPEEAAKRGNYGAERYENIDFQAQVRAKFMDMKKADDLSPTPTPRWRVLDACKSMEDIHQEIIQIVEETRSEVESQPIDTLKWAPR